MQKNKFRAMVYGAFYGDAYSLCGHWIYDTQQIHEANFTLHECNNPISSYHPTKNKGDFTHYGDQMFWLLQSLVKEDTFSLVDFGDTWHKNMKNYSGYIDGASKHTISKLDEERNYFACGSTSSDLSAVSRIFPIILKYKNSIDDMQEAIKLHTILTHMHIDLIKAGAFFSELALGLVNGLDLQQCINSSYKYFGDNILEWTEQAKSVLHLNTKEAIEKLGKSCSINGAFASTMYILLKYEGNFTQALKENMLAGGESAARGMIIGGILGIVHHKEILNISFLKQINKHQEIESLVNKLL